MILVLLLLCVFVETSTASQKSALCYTSLLYNDGMQMEFRVLGRSLVETGTVSEFGYPMIAFVTDEVSRETIGNLDAEGWIVRKVDKVANPNAQFPSRFDGVYTKLKIFELQNECEKVVFLDADTFLVKNPNRAFEACPGFCVVMRHSERFNTGVMVLTPGKEITERLFDLVSTTESYTGGEQGMLNTLFYKMVDAPMIHPVGVDDFRVGLIDGQNEPPVQLGMNLARLPTGFNAEPAFHWLSNRWSNPGKFEAVYILHFTLGFVKSSQWWVPLFFPKFVGWGWEETRNHLAPFSGVTPALWIGFIFLVSRTAYVMIKKNRSRSSTKKDQSKIFPYLQAFAHFTSTVILLKWLPSPLYNDAFQQMIYCLNLFAGVATSMQVMSCVFLMSKSREPSSFMTLFVAPSISVLTLIPCSHILGYTNLHGPVLLGLRVSLLFVVLPMLSLAVHRREGKVLQLQNSFLLSTKMKNVLPTTHRKKVMMNKA